MRRITEKSQCGSVLVLVVIFATVLSVTAASLLQFGMTERRLNKSNILFTEARNGAESMVEYGFSELKSRWQRQTSFNMTTLRSNPLTIPPSAADFFNSDSRIIFDDLELVGGNVPPGRWRYIDPADPANMTDPQKGKLVFSREVNVFGKAVATDPVFGERAAFCQQTFSIRDAPLFSHAIFYNMDLEFHPGPRMDMTGPVHSNGDIWLQAVNRLRFHETLMAAGNIYYGFKADPSGAPQNGNVFVKNASGDWTSFYGGSGDRSDPSSFFDSRMGETWRETATNRWGGNVGSNDHDVPTLNPVSIDPYVPNDPSTTVNERRNPAYALIEPVVPESHPNYKGDEVREQQFAYKAGLIFRVHQTPDATKPNGFDYNVEALTYRREDNKNPKSPPRMVDGEPQTQALNLSQVEASIGKTIISVSHYMEDGDGNPVSGFYDGRQSQPLDVIELDIGVLAELINEGESNPGTPWTGQYKLNPGSAVDWNGVVYVELPFDDSTSTRPDKVMPAARHVALRVVNGETVPNPSFAKSSGYDEGFTLATNGQLYVKGHFNADGDASTGSSTETDDGLTNSSKEAPVALLADSITILSSAFDDTKSKLGRNQRPAEFTEVSAALVTGLVPTLPGTDEQSGGAHNLPRFLEAWNGIEFRYRGSLVALYESEVGIAPLLTNFTWYHPPNRNWGYNELFAAGIYPPGTPNMRDFRRTNFKYLSEAEYEAELAALPGMGNDPSSRGHTPLSPGGGNSGGGNSGNSGGGNN